MTITEFLRKHGDTLERAIALHCQHQDSGIHELLRYEKRSESGTRSGYVARLYFTGGKRQPIELAFVREALPPLLIVEPAAVERLLRKRGWRHIPYTGHPMLPSGWSPSPALCKTCPKVLTCTLEDRFGPLP